MLFKTEGNYDDIVFTCSNFVKLNQPPLTRLYFRRGNVVFFQRW